MANKIHTFRVSGTSAFPLDMLRRDACWPTSQDGVSEIYESVHRNDPQALRVVTLNSNKRPTVGRWASFGWLVVEDDQ